MLYIIRSKRPLLAGKNVRIAVVLVCGGSEFSFARSLKTANENVFCDTEEPFERPAAPVDRDNKQVRTLGDSSAGVMQHATYQCRILVTPGTSRVHVDAA